MAENSIIPISLDEYFQSTPIGSVERAIGNNLYGFNHRQIPGLVPSNKDTYGLTFFTRPQLNLQAENIRNVRLFYPLLTEELLSVQRFVRCTLDPRLMAGYKVYNVNQELKRAIPPINCMLVDNTQAFIPVLTNNVNTVSGWPDVVAPVFTSDNGLYNEAYSMVDGITRYYESFDLDVNFRNTKGDPILYMFYIWLHYTSLVFENKLTPYMDYTTNNRIDYNTRIYRLVLDKDKRVVTKIAATGVAFPISVPTGSFFDYNHEKPYNDQNKDLSIRFRCLGAEYLDDILIKEFNMTVGIFKPEMRNDATRNQHMVLIDDTELLHFNNRGYPRINPSTYVLEWWENKSSYSLRNNFFNNLFGA